MLYVLTKQNLQHTHWFFINLALAGSEKSQTIFSCQSSICSHLQHNWARCSTLAGHQWPRPLAKEVFNIWYPARSGWIGPWALVWWMDPCSWQRGWNKMMFKVPSNPNRSMMCGENPGNAHYKPDFSNADPVITVHPFKGEAHFGWRIKWNIHRMTRRGLAFSWAVLAVQSQVVTHTQGKMGSSSPMGTPGCGTGTHSNALHLPYYHNKPSPPLTNHLEASR